MTDCHKCWNSRIGHSDWIQTSWRVVTTFGAETGKTLALVIILALSDLSAIFSTIWIKAYVMVMPRKRGLLSDRRVVRQETNQGWTCPSTTQHQHHCFRTTPWRAQASSLHPSECQTWTILLSLWCLVLAVFSCSLRWFRLLPSSSCRRRKWSVQQQNASTVFWHGVRCRHPCQTTSDHDGLVGKGRPNKRPTLGGNVSYTPIVVAMSTIDAPGCVHATYMFHGRSNNQRLKNKNSAVFYDAINTQ